MALNATLKRVTNAIVERSQPTRSAYLARIDGARGHGPHRKRLSCGNLAHGFAACGTDDKATIRANVHANIAIVTAYNDMLSAHQPYERYPDLIRKAARDVGSTAQVAGGVPAMCDGVTQGQGGMELSLFSRDVIAMSAAIALSHDMFDAALFLGICDKIVPGLLIAALSFGHLPAIFVPAGPMPSGISNDEKSRVRQLFAEGKASREQLLEAEAASYHSAGTCTFYGTANTNQMLMEIMGLHLPGASFVNPNTPLRDALSVAATQRVAAITALGESYAPLGHMVDERAIVNGIVGLHATGGSTNHLLHIVAIARAAGIIVTLEDFDALASSVPLLARVYPNGKADVNQFHGAGGLNFLIAQLLDAGLLHEDVKTVNGTGLNGYRKHALLDKEGQLAYVPVAATSYDETVLRGIDKPFRPDGGLRALSGNIGRAVIKVSAVPADRTIVEAPAIVFHEQDEIKAAFERGELDRDFIAVVRFQGPRANGMPELHKLNPVLGVLQDRGFKVAVVTDGRMSGASGKVPSAIHLTPEAANGGPIAKIIDGDIIRLDTIAGTLEVNVDNATFSTRPCAISETLEEHHSGLGRELFAMFRERVGPSDAGASVF